MPRVACVMMQKNESALLEPWIKYHASLFGLNSLYVFDNGSTHPDVIAMLKHYRAAGANIISRHRTRSAYARKGDIIADCIRRLQAKRQYDVALPMDCDEFLVVKNDRGASVEHDCIHAQARRCVSAGGLLRIGTQFFNIINRPGFFCRSDYTKTAIVLDGTFVSSDHGHHSCTTSDGNLYKPCDFAYVHYHYKPLEMLRQHARAKLAPFVDVDNPEALSSFDGPGHHLVCYVHMTQQYYQSWHGPGNFYQFTAFTQKLSDLQAKIPF